MKQCIWVAGASALAAVGMLALSACGSQDNAGASQEMCFASANGGTAGVAFTVQVLGASDCSNIASELNSSVLAVGDGYHVTANQGSASGSKICDGVSGNYPVYAYASKTGLAVDQQICGALGVAAVP